jgi:4-amino-4-deoxy-L-arabinose transferase-like glycosyltransferase
MNGTRPHGLVMISWMVIILAAAAGARVWYVGICADQGTHAGLLQVQGDRPEEVGTFPVGEGEKLGFREARLYPWLLSLLRQTAGEAPPPPVLARWIQCGLGSLTALLYYLFACRAFRSQLTGLLAGVLAAFHPFWIINTAEMNDGVLATFLLAASLFLGARGSQSGGPLTSWCYGLVLASLASERWALLPFAFVGILWFLLACRLLQRGWLYALLAFLGFLTGLAPWTLQNIRHETDPLPVVHATYVHVWQGVKPGATGGAEAADSSEEWTWTNQRLGEAIVREIQSDPGGVLQRRLGAALCFVVGEEWFKERKLWRVTEPAPPAHELSEWFQPAYPALLYGSFLGMVAFGLLGWRWSYAYRPEAMPAALAFVWVPLPYILGHADSLQGPRLPLDGVLLCYAALAVVSLGASLRHVFSSRPEGES